MMSLSDDKQADIIGAFNTTSRYLDDILNINNVYFDNMVSQIHPCGHLKGRLLFVMFIVILLLSHLVSWDMIVSIRSLLSSLLLFC